MPVISTRDYRPAVFACPVIGCSQFFKSDVALKRHQTVIHTVPEALRCHQCPNTSVEARADLFHSEGTYVDNPGHLYDGIHTEIHPILDGESLLH